MVAHLTLKNIVHHLIEICPEFKEYKDFGVWDINDPIEYTGFLGVFGRFFVGYIKTHDEKDLVSQRVFTFLNEQYNDSDSDEDALDYLGIEVFESIATSRKAINVAQKYLKGKALESLNATLEWYQPLSEDT